MEERYLDIYEIKKALGFAPVLEHLGVLGKMRQVGVVLYGPCPLPSHPSRGRNKGALSVNLKTGTWSCWSCPAGGDALDFIARMLGCNLSAAGDLLRTIAEANHVGETSLGTGTR